MSDIPQSKYPSERPQSPVSIRHQLVSDIPHEIITDNEGEGLHLFPSGISLCLTFHAGSDSDPLPTGAQAFPSGISLCLTFHLAILRAGLNPAISFVSIRHQPVSDIPLGIRGVCRLSEKVSIRHQPVSDIPLSCTQSKGGCTDGEFPSGISLCLTFHPVAFTPVAGHCRVSIRHQPVSDIPP